MKIALLSALNAERGKRSAAVLVTDLDSGEQRLVKAGQLKKDPLASALQEQLRTRQERHRRGSRAGTISSPCSLRPCASW